MDTLCAAIGLPWFRQMLKRGNAREYGKMQVREVPVHTGVSEVMLTRIEHADTACHVEIVPPKVRDELGKPSAILDGEDVVETCRPSLFRIPMPLRCAVLAAAEDNFVEVWVGDTKPPAVWVFPKGRPRARGLKIAVCQGDRPEPVPTIEYPDPNGDTLRELCRS